MKIRKLICTAIAAGVLMVSNVMPAMASVWGTVTDNGVNLRTGASVESDIATVLNKDTNITVIDRMDSWYVLSTANYGTAYIHSDYFKIIQADAKVTGDNVNVRSSGEIAENVIGRVNLDDSVTVVGHVGDWYKIIYNGGTAFVAKEFVSGDMLEYIKAADKSGTAVEIYITDYEEAYEDPFKDCRSALVCAETGLNLRQSPAADGDVVKIIPNGSTIYVVGVNAEGWAEVKCVSGAKGYVSSAYLKIEGDENIPYILESEASEYVAETEDFDFDSEEAVSDGSLASRIIEYAKRFIGTPYVWGGTDLEKGVDCSGYIYSVLKDFGISVDRTSRQMSSNGFYVSKDELRPGDLVFFDSDGVNDGQVSHVGMYIGDGKYIHSSSGKAYSVTITGLAEDYSSRTYVTARRVFE